MAEAMVEALARRAKDASRVLATVSTEHKNAFLLALADRLDANRTEILAANESDVEAARARGVADSLVDRLSLAGGRLAAIAADVRHVATLPDPVGETISSQTMPNGLIVERKRVPVGVLGVIYEARPNVTVDIASLAIKTGNAVVLRGGSETLASNRALVDCVCAALAESGLPPDSVQFIDSPDRARIDEMLTLHKYIDMIIPRGGANLHELCRQKSTIPVIIGGIGVCHLFVDESADLAKSVDVIVNAKTSRPSVCNSLDTLLVHREIATGFLPQVAGALLAKGVAIKVDDSASAFLAVDGERILAAVDGDFDTEWMSLVLGIVVVDTLDDAIGFVQAHSSGHSDGILTESAQNAARFLNEIDSAAVFWNASTRFNDGGAFGLGAEVAVSTQKLHARGPMGLEALTTYKWIATGDYLVRS